jgi:hypothetical protein
MTIVMETIQSSQAEGEEPSDPKVKGTDENVLQSASSGEGYSADCSASDQASDQSFDCAAYGQKQRSTMKLALNLLDLNHTSSEMEMYQREVNVKIYNLCAMGLLYGACIL